LNMHLWWWLCLYDVWF